MAVIAITVNATGTADEEDRSGMEYQIDKENARRAALDPPGTPLPKSTASERKASYETIAAAVIAGWHQENIDLGSVASLAQIKALWPTATISQRNAAFAALQ